MKTFSRVRAASGDKNLESAVFGTSGEVVKTLGQVTVGDGLGVHFLIVDSATPDGEDIIAVGGGKFAVTMIGETRFSTQPEMWNGSSWVPV